MLNIAKRELVSAAKYNGPIIEVHYESVDRDLDGFSEDHVIRVINIGSALSNKRIDMTSFLEIEYKGETYYKKINYLSSFRNSRKQGEIAYYSGYRSNYMFHNLWEQALSMNDLQVNIFHILMVKYHDLEGNKKSVYFKDYEEINEKQYKQYSDSPQFDTYNVFNIDQITCDELLKCLI